MPILYRAADADLPACFLVLLAPDWSEPVDLVPRLVSVQSEALTGIEERAPAHRYLRHRYQATYLLDETEAFAWRQVLASLADIRVGVALAPDLDITSPVYAAQRRVSWTDAGTVAILEPGEAVPHPHVAPLLLGRLVERPPLPIEGANQRYRLRLVLEEDAPAACRLDPASGTVPTGFEWEPDWSSEPVDRSRDQLRPVEMGQGRETGIAGADGTPRWGQSATFTLDRAEAAALLRFFLDRQGSVRSFEAPAWCSPLDPTPDTWDARFDRDHLALRWISPWWVQITLDLWQQVTLEEGEPAQEAEARSFLYTFTSDGAAVARLTSWEHSLSHGGQAYAPARIEHDSLRRTLTPLGDECEVSLFAGEPSNPLAPFARGEAERRLFITISEVRVAADGSVSSAAALFAGEVRKIEHRGDRLVGRAASFGAMFARRLPRFYVQRGCNYVLGDACCGLTMASLAREGTISAEVAPRLSEFTPTTAPTGDHAASWFAGGWIEVTGTDAQLHRRAILDCSEASGVWSLLLNRSLPATCADQAATAYPGCDGNHSTCKAKFANGDAFGGHPFSPAFIATSDGVGGSTRVK